MLEAMRTMSVAVAVSAMTDSVWVRSRMKKVEKVKCNLHLFNFSSFSTLILCR